MSKVEEQQYGIGLESEGYVLDSTGQVIPTIFGQPTIQWLLKEIAQKKPKLLAFVSPELASFIVEVKSEVFEDVHRAIEQILEIRAEIDQLFKPHFGQLIFQPVLDKPFEFYPSTNDINSRAYQLTQQWSNHPASVENLRASSICSLQINDSRPFRPKAANIDLKDSEVILQVKRLEIARQIHNLFSGQFDYLKAQNRIHLDFYGKTRLDYYLNFVNRVKGSMVQKYCNYNSAELAALPPQFLNIEAMQKWMSAHSNTSDFKKAKSKNEHAVTVKIKRETCWVAETRIFDAVNTEAEMKRLTAINQKILLPLI